MQTWGHYLLLEEGDLSIRFTSYVLTIHIPGPLGVCGYGSNDFVTHSIHFRWFCALWTTYSRTQGEPDCFVGRTVIRRQAL